MEELAIEYDYYNERIVSGLIDLRHNEECANVTIAVEGRMIKAHKLILSIFSPYLKEVLASLPSQHPVIFLKDVRYNVMQCILQFMYEGKVVIDKDDLSEFLLTGKALHVVGLNNHNMETSEPADSSLEEPECTPTTIKEEYEGHVEIDPLPDPEDLGYDPIEPNYDPTDPNYDPNNDPDYIVSVNEYNETSSIDSDNDEKLGIRSVEPANMKDRFKKKPRNSVAKLIKSTRNVNVHYYRTHKGLRVYCDNFLYRKHDQSKASVTWRCATGKGKPSSCKAYIRITFANEVFFGHAHSHSPPPLPEDADLWQSKTMPVFKNK